MPSLELADLQLEYEVLKPTIRSRANVVLVHGLGCQLIQWPPMLLQSLLDAGYQVLRFDNRDVGLSKLRQPPRPKRQKAWDLLRWRLGARLDAAYSLADMAQDTVALMDHLGWEQVHVVGVSMGGMIAQELAIQQPQRLLSQSIIMSTSGRRSVGTPRPSVIQALMRPPPSSEPEVVIEHLVGQWRVQRGRKHHSSEETIREEVRACVQRGLNGSGFLRQLQAVMNAPNREPRLRQVRVPTLVLHGKDDPLIHCSGGKSVAKAIPQARLELIDGWGHDWPLSIQPLLAEHLLAHFEGAA